MIGWKDKKLGEGISKQQIGKLFRDGHAPTWWTPIAGVSEDWEPVCGERVSRWRRWGARLQIMQGHACQGQEHECVDSRELPLSLM
jgi:hypothetical protein